ncbi:MAG: hypothetical protein RH862_00535 [Leptospiraceae bacterium]
MKLDLMETIQNGIQRGLKNAPALIVNGILWALTAWIPYLNAGTTIGMANLPAKMASDETLSMTEIFNPEYRKSFGEFFITVGLISMGVMPAFFLVFFPGYVLLTAWSLAVLLVLDQKLEPLAALRKSNELTYGNKWTIFFAKALPPFGIFLIAGIGMAISEYLGGFLYFIGFIALTPVSLGISAEIYKKLAKS